MYVCTSKVSKLSPVWLTTVYTNSSRCRREFLLEKQLTVQVGQQKRRHRTADALGTDHFNCHTTPHRLHIATGTIPVSIRQHTSAYVSISTAAHSASPARSHTSRNSKDILAAHGATPPVHTHTHTYRSHQCLSIKALSRLYDGSIKARLRLYGCIKAVLKLKAVSRQY